MISLGVYVLRRAIKACWSDWIAQLLGYTDEGSLCDCLHEIQTTARILRYGSLIILINCNA